MSNLYNQEIMERLYDEAYEELRPHYEIKWSSFRREIHKAAIALAKQRFEQEGKSNAYSKSSRNLSHPKMD